MKITVDTQGWVEANLIDPARSPDELVRVIDHLSNDDFRIALETCKLLELRYSGKLPGIELEAVSAVLLSRKLRGGVAGFFPRFTVVLRDSNGDKIKCAQLCIDLLKPQDRDYVSQNIALCARYVANRLYLDLCKAAERTRKLADNLQKSAEIFSET